MANLQPLLVDAGVQRLRPESHLRMNTSAKILSVVGAIVLLAGCSTSEQHATSSPPATGSSTLTVPPTFDAKSGLWLSDGWPVPDPSATFDPNAPWMSADGASRLIADCLTEKGWAVTVTGPSEFNVDTPPEQKSAYDNDVKNCNVTNRIGIDPAPPLTKELAQREYDAQVRTRKCLIKVGREVPEAPSYQVFEDALLTEGRIIGIYQLATDAGINLSADPAVLKQCPDPIDTWGHN